MVLDLDKCIAKVRECEYLTEDELKDLCELVSLQPPCFFCFVFVFFSEEDR